ncbi:MAG: trypsin-like peptidase domain-containing protein [Caldilinea sp.]|nr:trypsin-like peptidase domain-containing protein [Caldilinea sp.]MCB0147144.1 trypsin-like peptidase domain-containing protein [Caldilineaceae bacterium]MCB9116320.1 trypsin-like peptidase domain-containing protein [Caldilineaceae bacterium]MCO5213612.1 trypsin-like peptidase domain-containing protein [Caldilinea sp.]MCW5843283.1 trypsin-like peptidase domain-containing protein [Caldilinea sp.]
MSDILKSVSEAMAGLAESAGQSVVRVEGRNRLPASGVVYAADGIIVTSHHVVERDDKLRVGLPTGETVDAELVGRDPGTDLAVLRVAATGLTPAAWVDAGDLRVGNLILALGRPGQSVQATLGIVSALGGAWRTGGGGEIDRYLQTDVVMYPGFSGGPLTTADGRFGGINSSALARGVSVTIPAATVARVVATLLAHGRMPRGYMGVGIQPVRLDTALQEQLGQATGLMLMSVEAGGPAAEGGLLQGDVVVTLDGGAVRQLDDLQALLTGDRVGRRVAVRYVRAGAVQEAAVTVGQK